MAVQPKTEILFNEVRVTRVSEDVVRQITEAIADGRLPPGTKLPSQRELQGMFRAGRGAILEALRILETSGLVSVKRGAQGGTFINPLSANKLADALLVMVRVNQVSLDELVSFREVIETHTAAAAATAHTKETLKALEEAAGELAQLGEHAEDDWHAFIVAELKCHSVLTKAAGNRLIDAFMSALYSTTLDAFLQIPPTYGGRIVRDWNDILEAVRGKDPQRATELMSSHIRRFAKTIEAERHAEQTTRRPLAPTSRP